jgi:hypothetical protein
VSLVGFLFANVTWLIGASIGKAVRRLRVGAAPRIERRSAERR